MVVKVDHNKANAYLQEIEDKIKSVNVEDLKKQMVEAKRLAGVYKGGYDLMHSILTSLEWAIEGDHPHKTVYLIEDIYKHYCSNNIYEHLTPDEVFTQLIDFIIYKYEYTHKKTISVINQLY